MYSALKHQGQRLYELARKGEEVERKARDVTIHALSCLGFTADTLELDVHCSKGTYIRTLVEDIGERLGCGAHVIELRRLGLGPFEAPAMVTLEEIEARAEQGEAALDALLAPIDRALTQWPAVRLDRDSAYYLRQGQAVFVPGAPTRGLVRVYGPGRPSWPWARSWTMAGWPPASDDDGAGLTGRMHSTLYPLQIRPMPIPSAPGVIELPTFTISTAFSREFFRSK